MSPVKRLESTSVSGADRAAKNVVTEVRHERKVAPMGFGVWRSVSGLVVANLSVRCTGRTYVKPDFRHRDQIAADNRNSVIGAKVMRVATR